MYSKFHINLVPDLKEDQFYLPSLSYHVNQQLTMKTPCFKFRKSLWLFWEQYNTLKLTETTTKHMHMVQLFE